MAMWSMAGLTADAWAEMNERRNNDLPPRRVDPVLKWMRIAYEVAQQSPDPSTQNGAVVLKSWDEEKGGGEKIASACNDVTEGIDATAELLADRACKSRYVEHAERAALHKAHRFSRSSPHVMVCPWAACCDCARAIVGSGVRLLIRHAEAMAIAAHGKWAEEIEEAEHILAAGGVEIRDWSGEVHKTVLRNGEEVRL